MARKTIAQLEAELEDLKNLLNNKDEENDRLTDWYAELKLSSGKLQNKLDKFLNPGEEVNHPAHYNKGKYEVIEVLQDWFKKDPLAWQSVKYIARFRHKGFPVKDLEKAKFYLERLIEETKQEVENENSTS